MKREETIKMYVEQFLEGKSERQREAFLSKDVNKQYASIMAWKYRNKDNSKASAIGYSDLSRHLRSFSKLVPTADDLSPRQVEKLKNMLDEAKNLLDNLDQARLARQLKDLEDQRRALDAKIVALQQKC